jgi:hypothetical protein
MRLVQQVSRFHVLPVHHRSRSFEAIFQISLACLDLFMTYNVLSLSSLGTSSEYGWQSFPSLETLRAISSAADGDWAHNSTLMNQRQVIQRI